MRLPDAEVQDAIKFWGLAFVGVVVCLVLGREAAAYSSPWLPAAVLAVSVGLLTFYSPRAALGVIVFAMLLSPKVRGGTLSSDSSHGSLVIRFDDIFLIVIFFAWIARKAMTKGSAFLIRTPVNLPIFLYTAVNVISTSLAVMRGDIAPLRSLFYVLKYVEYFFLFFMTVNIVEDDEDMRTYLWCAWLTAIAVTIYGWAQIPAGVRVSAPFEDFVGDQKGAGEANTLGGYYLVVFGGLLALYTQSTAAASTLALSSLLFMLPPFFMTLSRSSYMGLSAAFAYLILSTRKRRLRLLMGVGSIMMLLFLVPTLREKVVTRVMYTFNGGGYALQEMSLGPLGKVHLEGSTMARLWSWRKIIFLQFPKHPFLGSGVTAVGLVDAQFPLILGETGLIGISLFFLMLYRVWFVASRLHRYAQTELQRVLSFAVMTAMIGLLVQGLSTNTFIIVRIMEPFWFLAALTSRSYVNLLRSGAMEA